MNVREIEVEKLVPYENNPRMNDDAVGDVAESIKQFGFRQPIVVDKDLVIVAGHTRHKAALKLGLKKVPIEFAEDLTPAQVKAYRILDNKVSEKAVWDTEKLGIELRELGEMEFDLSPFSVDLSNIDGAASGSVNTADDIVPSVSKATPQSTVGDVWMCGKHRVTCGDCRDPGVVNRLFKNHKAALVLTDPPYGVSYVGKTEEELTIENDALSEEELQALWCNALDQADRVLCDGGSIYATVPAGPLHLVFALELKRRQWLRQILVWAKNAFVLGRSDYHYQHEPILYGWKPGASHYFIDVRNKASLLSFDRPQASREHPTMKPLALWIELLTNSTKEGAVVFDPFLGSGTTLLSAERSNRVCYGIELVPVYCDVVLQRYFNETGLAPKTEEGKEFVPLKDKD